eukprot:763400-Hanusia_phi.AAC.3
MVGSGAEGGGGEERKEEEEEERVHAVRRFDDTLDEDRGGEGVFNYEPGYFQKKKEEEMRMRKVEQDKREKRTFEKLYACEQHLDEL